MVEKIIKIRVIGEVKVSSVNLPVSFFMSYMIERKHVTMYAAI